MFPHPRNLQILRRLRLGRLLLEPLHSLQLLDDGGEGVGDDSDHDEEGEEEDEDGGHDQLDVLEW